MRGIVGRKWKIMFNPPQLRQLMMSKTRKSNDVTELDTITGLDCLTPDVINDIENRNQNKELVCVNDEIVTGDQMDDSEEVRRDNWLCHSQFLEMPHHTSLNLA